MTPRPDHARLREREQHALLREVVRRCAHAAGTPAPVVVFDLDETLMDSRPRTVAILREFAERCRDRDPALADRLARAAPEQLAYLLSDTLESIGAHPTALADEMHAFWRDRFFADPHLAHDVPVAGAVTFARACHEAGAILVYMTGRDLPQMGVGTFASLRDLGFPIGVPATELVLKPDAAMADETFKRATAPELAKLGAVAATFDNDPTNCNAFRAIFAHAEVVLVDTLHMPGAPALAGGVKVIADFRMG